jgi:hypothetical protein
LGTQQKNGIVFLAIKFSILPEFIYLQARCNAIKVSFLEASPKQAFNFRSFWRPLDPLTAVVKKAQTSHVS